MPRHSIGQKRNKDIEKSVSLKQTLNNEAEKTDLLQKATKYAPKL